ncbi:hypothetical protein FACS1894155_07610 [Bacteroidia bacterium]|nr:hypothetical protein FACS1894155_07610 [Bacteroidia bacterium]
MIMSMKKIITILLVTVVLFICVFSFIKINTNIYIGNYSYNGHVGIDIQLKIDDKLILTDSLYNSPFFPTVLTENLKYGFHKIKVSSKRADINQEGTIFLLPNQHIYIEFFPADTLTYRHYNFPDSIIMNGVQLTDSMINQYKLPEELDFPIENEQSSFWITSRFNPFYTE